MAKNKEENREYGLIEVIDKDGSLEKDEKLEFKSLARLFQQDFEENIRRTSIQIDDAYETNKPSMWRKFLHHTSIKNFIDDYLYEDMEKQAIKAMGGENGFKESNKALKVKKVIDEKRKGEDNSNFVVVMLPRKTDDIGDTSL